MLLYSEIVEAYNRIESTTKRLEITDYLVHLIKQTPKDIIDRVAYLTLGRLYPLFVPIEIGIAEKTAIKAIATAFGESASLIEEKLKETGDLGLTVEALAKQRTQAPLGRATELTVDHVYDTLDKIAKTSGTKSQEIKNKLLSGLLTGASPGEAKYIIRMATGTLRLGIADMTLLDALAVAFTESKSNRTYIETAYNLSSDIGLVAKTLATQGIAAIKKFRVRVGSPIRPMLAQRLTSAKEILEKLGGRAACEYKYDGERIQVHKKGEEVRLFSRRLEDIGDQYPDVCELAKKYVKAKDAILEGECVALDLDAGEFKPFQELMHRRRKYGVKEAIDKYPVGLYSFDVLYVDGKDTTTAPYSERRKILEKIIDQSDRVKLAEALVSDDVNKIEVFFEEAIEAGCEGLVLKSVSENSFYQAGARGWNWIKLKRSYQSKMVEPIEVVIVGAFRGRGKRAGTYGAILVAVYDEEADSFKTVCKVGTGFTDEALSRIPKVMEELKILHRHGRVDAILEADVWFSPGRVIEIIGDEITLSPIHTCAMNMIRKGSGLAVRFPRFTGKWREDKGPEEATTSQEIVDMYRKQLKTVKEE
ncbi:MAG: ATP-dependent DNA ligase [Promethearchaeati archaeon SRVP18_Atabeyarchaeia-1]